MAGIFGEFFLVSVSHETKHEKSSKNSGKIRSKIRAKIRDEKFKKFGELSVCSFSDLTNSRFALHGLAPHKFMVCALFLPLDTWLGNPFFASLSIHIWGNPNGGSQNGGLSPKFLEKIGEKYFRENRAFSGLIGAFSGPIGAFSGLIGTDSSAPHSRGEAAKVPPKGPFWAQLAPFGLSPRLLSPRLDFPNHSLHFTVYAASR